MSNSVKTNTEPFSGITRLERKVFPLSLLNTVIIFLVIAFAGTFFTVYNYISHETDAILDIMIDKLIHSKGQSVKNAINYYVNIPRQANLIIAHGLQESGEAIPSLSLVQSELQNIVDNVFNENNYLSSVAFGNIHGDYVGIARKKNSLSEEYLTLKSPETNNELTFFNGTTLTSGVEDVLYGYDMSIRPWYAIASKTRRSTWTPAYRDMNSTNGVSISYSSPTYNKNGQFTGVVSSDLHLTELNTFLDTVKPFPNSLLLVLNNNNQIVASNDASLTTGKSQGRLVDQKGLTLPLISSSSSMSARAAGGLMNTVEKNSLAEFHLNGERNFVLFMPIGQELDLLDWKVVIIVPEVALMQEMSHARHLALIICLAIFTLGLALILVVVSRVISPLKLITQKADKLVDQPWILSSNKWRFPEIAYLDLAFFRLSQKVSRSFFALEKQINEDASTGLMSRAGLLQSLRRAPDRHYNLLAVVYTASLSSITNLLGSEYAEQYLSDFIEVMKKNLPAGTLLCRDCVDKFIIIYPGHFSQQICAYYQHRLDVLFGGANTYTTHNVNKYTFTGYVGMVYEDITADTVHSSIMNAYIALKKAQQDEQSRVKLYEQYMREQELRNIRLHESLRDALINNEFYLVMQPIVDLQTTESVEGECLIRWQSPQWGHVSPDCFITLAEETGLMLPLGNWIIEKACAELATLISRGASPDFKLHINVSANQLLQHNFSTHLLKTIQQQGLVNQNICIEITETVLLREIAYINETLCSLRQKGISVAIDDFGSGFSSLSYLHKLPFDAIKIDRQFVADVLNDKKNASIISSVITLAEGFGVPLIAEGIETEEVRQRLLALGCPKAQGYHFCRPAPFNTYTFSDGKLIYR